MYLILISNSVVFSRKKKCTQHERASLGEKKEVVNGEKKCVKHEWKEVVNALNRSFNYLLHSLKDSNIG